MRKAAARVRHRWEVWQYRRRLVTPRLLTEFAVSYPEAFFVEIGANDGRKFDHLSSTVRSKGWRGIMVEPVPHIFDELRENFGDEPGVALENVAIAARDGTLPFFHLRPANDEEVGDLPPFYDAIGSFSRDVLVSHRDTIPDIEERVVEIEVPCLTFDSLLARHAEPAVDVLVMDVEGYDWQLLQTVDLERHRPRLVVFEHYHLSPDDRSSCMKHLEDAGYVFVGELLDTWCLDARIDDGLTSLWRSSRSGHPVVSIYDSVSQKSPS